MSVEKINRILDKINESGIKSLLNLEKIYLDKISKKEDVDFLDKFLINDVGLKISYNINDTDFEFEFADTELDIEEETNIKHLGILKFKNFEFYGYIIVDDNGEYIYPEFYDKKGSSLVDDFDFTIEEISVIETFLIQASVSLSGIED